MPSNTNQIAGDSIDFKCTGCGTTTANPDKQLKDLRKAGAISCCPERKMVQVKEAPLLDEGDPCPCTDCSGKMEYEELEGCSCHISPPCAACTNLRLECSVCGWMEGDDVE